jgi:hypothetical protein
MSWGTTWARPNVYEMLSIVRLVLACGLPTQKAGHALRDEQDSDDSGLYQGRNFAAISASEQLWDHLLVKWVGVHLGGIYVRGVCLGHGCASHLWACTL